MFPSLPADLLPLNKALMFSKLTLTFAGGKDWTYKASHLIMLICHGGGWGAWNGGDDAFLYLILNEYRNCFVHVHYLKKFYLMINELLGFRQTIFKWNDLSGGEFLFIESLIL